MYNVSASMKLTLVPELKKLGLQPQVGTIATRAVLGKYKGENISISINCSPMLTGATYESALLSNDKVIYLEELNYDDVLRFDTMEELVKEIIRLQSLMDREESEVEDAPLAAFKGIEENKSWVMSLILSGHMLVCKDCNGVGCTECNNVGAVAK